MRIPLAIPLLVALIATSCSARNDDSVHVPVALEIDGDAPRHFLLISVDTLRRDAIGRYGDADESSASPTLDALLHEGLALDNHRSCSNWTYPSMLCALGGGDTLELGFEPFGRDVTQPSPLEGDIALVAETLASQDFRTTLISTNGFMSDTYGMATGYDQSLLINEQPAETVVAEAIAELETVAASDQRSFLHLHFMDPHAPYAPPDEYIEALEGLASIEFNLENNGAIGRLNRKWDQLSEQEQALIQVHLTMRYQGLVRYWDDQLGVLVEALEETGLADDVLILVINDHGEQFGERGTIGHGATVGGAETDGIAGFWARDITPRTWGRPTTHADLVPTALRALGVETEQSFGGTIVGESSSDRPLLIHNYRGKNTQQSVEREGWKLVFNWLEGTFELYERTWDPGEEENLIDENTEMAAALWELMQPQTEELSKINAEIEVAMDGP